jgi:CRISPR-associated protein Csm5
MKYTVTVLTPLLVGDGHELAPIDYMVWKDQVNVLDQARIFKLLARGPRLDGYLAQLRKATKLDFASWGGFAQNFSQRRIPFEHPGSSAIWNSAPSESLFIPTFAADHRGAYLPASALKGALRTSLVFSRWTANTIDRIASSIEGDRVPRRLAEPAEINSGASQVRVISVADSQPVPTAAFKVFLTRVASLDTRQPGNPQLAWKIAGRGSVPPHRISDATSVFAEMASPGTAFRGEWHERTFLEHEDLAHALGWRSVLDTRALLDAANQHAGMQLELHARYAEATGLNGLQETVQHLNRELASTKASTGTCLVCLGWGSGFLSKTGFLQTERESYRKILRSLPGFAKAIREGVPFPKTRRIVFAGGQPSTMPGWVKLQVEQ